MQSADLNLATTVTGHQRFLFIKLPAAEGDSDFIEAMMLLGDGMENMHYVTGPPSAEAFRKGRFQFLKAEPAIILVVRAAKLWSPETLAGAPGRVVFSL